MATVTVYVKQDGPVQAIEIENVDDASYSKSNENTGQPDILEVLDNVKSSDWDEYKVVASFHVSDIIGYTITGKE